MDSQRDDMLPHPPLPPLPEIPSDHRRREDLSEVVATANYFVITARMIKFHTCKFEPPASVVRERAWGCVSWTRDAAVTALFQYCSHARDLQQGRLVSVSVHLDSSGLVIVCRGSVSIL